MKKATQLRPKSVTQFEQIPVATVKRLAGVTAAPTPDQPKPAVADQFVSPVAKEVKRDRYRDGALPVRMSQLYDRRRLSLSRPNRRHRRPSRAHRFAVSWLPPRMACRADCSRLEFP